VLASPRIVEAKRRARSRGEVGQAVPSLTVIASSARYGPLVRKGQINQAVIDAMKRAEAGLPEGARVQLVISGFRHDGPGLASSAIQTAFRLGQITDPASGERIRPWPEYPHQIAFADNARSRLTLRWLKGQPWAVILIILLASILAGLLMYYLGHSSWSLQGPPGGGGSRSCATTPAVGFDCNGVLRVGYLPWWDALIAAAALAALPVALHYTGRLEEGEAELIRGREELQQARGGWGT